MGNSLETVDVRAKKRVLAEFVKDMAELESEELQARKTAEECFNEVEEIRRKKERELEKLERELEYKKNFIEKPRNYKPHVLGLYLKGLLKTFGWTLLATVAMFELFYNISYIIKLPGWTWIVGWGIVGLVFVYSHLSYIFGIRKKKDEFKNKIREYPYLILKEEQNIAEFKKETEAKVAFVQKHGEEYVKYADKLSEEKGKLYALNVVPPDYRYMKCILILDYVFRNDLADDMRGAILYYEDRCYKQVVEEGFDRIVDAIEDLTAEMRHLHRSLERIDKRAKEICGEISRAADGIAINNTLQAATLAENYSAHQKMEYYAEQYRQGLL